MIHPLPEQLITAENAFRAGDHASAEALLAKILAKEPRSAKANEIMGYIAGTRGDYPVAARCLTIAANAKGSGAQAWYFLGLANQKLQKYTEASAAFRRALKEGGEFFEGLHELGLTLLLQGQPAQAITQFDKALVQFPHSCATFINKGLALGRLGRKDEEYHCYKQVLDIEPMHRDALINIGSVAAELDKFDEADAWFDKAAACFPEVAEVHNLYGAALYRSKRSSESLAQIGKALALAPEYVEAWFNRATVLSATKQYDDAIRSFDRALSLRSGYIEAWLGLGTLFNNIKQYEKALSCFDEALKIQPRHVEAWFGRAMIQNNARKYEDAIQSFSTLHDIAPEYPFVKGRLLYAKLLACDWKKLEPLKHSIKADLKAGRKSAEPFGYQAIAESAADLKRCAEIFSAATYPPQRPLSTSLHPHSKSKLRIGYVSGEFRDHATSILLVGLLEEHDKNGFEIILFDNGWDDGSPVRRRLNAAVAEVIDISRLSGIDAAREVAERRIDILVNLNGYFGDSRQDVFSFKPAPVQVNYLGFPGTLGAPYMDYLFADRCVIPEEQAHDYTEEVVYLPHSYQANDGKRLPVVSRYTRKQLQLPETGFVFCCFNNNYKITPDVFAVWMRLLKQVPGSVLWLLEDNSAASRNLKREAERQGVPAERLIFAPRMKHEDHMPRHLLADLFLDTLPYNAHTTASDALWSGLPVLTCLGGTFPGRVGASLLHAMGLSELVTNSLDEYAQRALALAHDPARLSNLRSALVQNRLSHPLFDTIRFARNIECAYIEVWNRHCASVK